MLRMKLPPQLFSDEGILDTSSEDKNDEILKEEEDFLKYQHFCVNKNSNFKIDERYFIAKNCHIIQ